MNKPKSYYGGQAVIEGVMMRGKQVAVIAVRNPHGDIVIHEEKLTTWLHQLPLSQLPFLRGIVGLWDSLTLGTKSLMWSANVAMGIEQPVRHNTAAEGSMVFTSLVMGTMVFFITPAAGSNFIGHRLGIKQRFLLDVVEGSLKLSFLISYLSLVGQVEGVQRVFAYHGAEHKTINAYEAGSELTPDKVQFYSVEHPRCGTAFLLTVLVLSIFVNTLFKRPKNFFALILRRLLLMPVIAGLSYEVLRWTATHAQNPTVKMLIAPNLALQHLTTRPPDDSMLEVAIAALQRVLDVEDAPQE